MRRHLLWFGFLLILGQAPAWAAEKWSLRDWLKEMEAKVRRADEKQKKQLVAAAAIRGDQKDNPSAKKLYWKGKKESRPATPEETANFKAALGLAQEGKNAEAEKSFSAFLEKYPDSPLAPDAEKTLALLKESCCQESETAPASSETRP